MNTISELFYFYRNTLLKIYLIILCVFMNVYVCVAVGCYGRCVCGGQRTTSSIIWVPGSEVKLKGLATRALVTEPYVLTFTCSVKQSCRVADAAELRFNPITITVHKLFRHRTFLHLACTSILAVLEPELEL